MIFIMDIVKTKANIFQIFHQIFLKGFVKTDQVVESAFMGATQIRNN